MRASPSRRSTSKAVRSRCEWLLGIETWGRDIASGVLVGYVARQGDKIEGYCLGDTLTGEVVVLALLPSAEDQGVGREWRPTGQVDANDDEILELRLTLPAS